MCIYNEFKSVIAQRLVAQRILPVQEIGRREVVLTEEFSLEERERLGEAARTAGISLKEAGACGAGAPSGEIRALSRWTTSTGEAAERDFFRSAAALRVRMQLFQAHAGVGGGRTRGAHDCHGFGQQ